MGFCVSEISSEFPVCGVLWRGDSLRTFATLGLDIRNGWQPTWHQTREGLAYFNTLQSWLVKLDPDGTFRISGVPPGDYDLAIQVYVKPTGCLIDPIARKVIRVTVTADDLSKGVLRMPEIATEVIPGPEVGDVPALSFEHVDGAQGTLADSRGKYTLVHFWASWCGPCKRQIPAVRRIHEQFAPRGLVMLGLSLDEQSTAWQDALKRLDLGWQQGRLSAADIGGISSVPVYWLLDPAGKLVDKISDADELAAKLADRLK